MTVSTGVPGLDAMLRGGIPSDRVVLVSGGPGTGKSTLGMQFLQAGLGEGDRCLYVSTEQTPEEIRDAFRHFDFDLDHERLAVVGLHATPGTTLETGEETMTLRTAPDVAVAPEDFSRPFTSQYVKQALQSHLPCDRVVLDSVSGLASMTEDDVVSRRMVLALVRLFADEFRATTLFVGEDHVPDGNADAGTMDALRYNAHGIIRLWLEPIEGEHHRFVRIAKMRGVDHDTRTRKVQLRPDGVRLIPDRRTRAGSLVEREHRGTGLPGLDQLLGNGLISGSTAMLEHDGRADIDPITMSIIVESLREGESIVLFPSANIDPERFDAMLPPDVESVDELLAGNQLFVLDFAGTWSNMGANVFGLTQGAGPAGWLERRFRALYYRHIKRATQRINRRRGRQPANAVMYNESLLQHLSPAEIRKMYYWAKGTLLRPDDRVLFVQNPGVMDSQLAEFYAYDAEQILHTWLHPTGLQFIRLEKSPSGELGSSRLVRPIESSPHVAVEQGTVNGGIAHEFDEESDDEGERRAIDS